MIKLAVAFLLNAFLFCTYGQKFDGYVVTNANDTISGRFVVQTNMIDPKILLVATIKDKIRIITDKGEKLKFYSKEAKSFLVKGTKFGDLKFVSLKYDDFERFYHEVTAGKITYYRFYKGGMPTFGISFGLKDDEFVELQGPKVRQVLGEMIKDYPELHDKWMDSDTYRIKQMEEVITLYNEYFKK